VGERTEINAQKEKKGREQWESERRNGKKKRNRWRR
jgi:hypothetical protein